MTITKPQPAATAYLRDEDRPWVSGEGGASMRILTVSHDTGTWVVQTRMPPGLRSPTHRHTGRVYAFTHRGRWGYVEYDWIAGPGSFVHEQAGVSHTLVVPEDSTESAEVTYVVEGGNIYTDDDGNVLSYEDGQSMLVYYTVGCEAAGVPVPTDLVR